MLVGATAFSEEHDGEPSDPKTNKVSVKQNDQTGPFKGYGRYQKKFVSLCEAMQEDGRLEYLVSTARAFSERDITCEACRPLYQTFTSSCGRIVLASQISQNVPTSKSKKKATQTELPEVNHELVTPTKIPYALQREPSALVIDRATRLFADIAEDKDLLAKTKQALDKLSFIMLDKSRTTVRSREYYTQFFSYIMPFFEEKEIKGEKSLGITPLDPKQKTKKLDSMFDN